MKQRWYYIRRHPVTEELQIASEVMQWEAATGEWQLPGEQPTLPDFAPGSTFSASEDEALAMLGRMRRAEDGDAEGIHLSPQTG